MGAVAAAPPANDKGVSTGRHADNGNTSSSGTCTAVDAAESSEGSSGGERERERERERESAREDGEGRGTD